MSSTTITGEFQPIVALVGAAIIRIEACRWGFENETAMATLSDGRDVIVQRIRRIALADHKIELLRTLPPRLAAVGIATPTLIAADPPLLMRAYLPGTPANAMVGDATTAPLLAAEMGSLLERLRRVDTNDTPLDTTWATSASLVVAAAAWLTACRDLLPDRVIAAFHTAIAGLPGLFAGRTAAFAHGDFCPVNGLTLDNRLVALIDLEYARIADPLFDPAWWSWVVRYHHPGRWQQIWPDFCRAAAITADTMTNQRIATIQCLYLLERTDLARRYEPEAAGFWADRLITTADW
ncbi:MAG TPA: phosphotransferase [Roseiflexaceae bacterium]|nr:phosphotransferase [Roseiflexaceae bacterium]